MAKEKQTHSVTHHEERHAKIRQEAMENEAAADAAEEEHREKKAERDARMSADEDKRLTEQAGLLPEGETRDQLLERIRQMRAGSREPEVPVPLGISPYQQGIREIEEQAGREAVARAEARMAEANKQREAAEKERIAREGEMVEVHHPNPSQNEQYPAQKATLGKTKK